MRIQHNIAALNSYRQLGSNNNSVSKNLEKLSSGYRINRAGDDAAGLAISEKMRAQITGLETAAKNANDGISLVQTAEGALTEVHSMLNRMVELAEQSANGTYQDSVDRENLQKEVKSLKEEVDRISESTNFNGINLLDGSLAGGKGVSSIANLSNATDATAAADAATSAKQVSDPVAAGQITTDQTIKVTYLDKTGTAKSVEVTVKGTDFGADEKTAATAISDALNKVSGGAFKTSTTGSDAKVTFEDGNTGDNGFKVVGFSMNGTDVPMGAVTPGTNERQSIKFSNAAGTDTKLTIDGKNFQIAKQGDTIAEGYIGIFTDDGKVATADQQKTVISQLDKYGIKAEIGADAQTLKFEKTDVARRDGLSLQIGDTADSFNQLSVKVGSMSSSALGISAVDLSTQSGSKSAVKLIKDAINSVSSTRGDLGALQNRLEHTINNLSVTSENMTAAESRIRDVDMAKEMMNYTKNNILVQASQAMLAQANQVPQGVLQLLK